MQRLPQRQRTLRLSSSAATTTTYVHANLAFLYRKTSQAAATLEGAEEDVTTKTYRFLFSLPLFFFFFFCCSSCLNISRGKKKKLEEDEDCFLSLSASANGETACVCHVTWLLSQWLPGITELAAFCFCAVDESGRKVELPLPPLQSLRLQACAKLARL